MKVVLLGDGDILKKDEWNGTIDLDYTVPKKQRNVTAEVTVDGRRVLYLYCTVSRSLDMGSGSGRKSSSSSSGNSGGTSVYSSTSGSSSSGFQEVSGVTTKVVARKDTRSSNNKDYGTLVLKFYKNGSPYQFESGNYAVSFDIVACGYHHGNKTPWEFTVR